MEGRQLPERLRAGRYGFVGTSPRWCLFTTPGYVRLADSRLAYAFERTDRANSMPRVTHEVAVHYGSGAALVRLPVKSGAPAAAPPRARYTRSSGRSCTAAQAVVSTRRQPMFCSSHGRQRVLAIRVPV